MAVIITPAIEAAHMYPIVWCVQLTEMNDAQSGRDLQGGNENMAVYPGG